MAPHSMESILQAPQWPASLSHFVTWCLMWDPKHRPTSTQALNHEYFADALDPLRPKSSTARLLGRKQSDKSFKSSQSNDSPSVPSKSSWFRRSLIGRTESQVPTVENEQPTRPPVVSYNVQCEAQPPKAKPGNTKRATWTNGAPMPILPSIRPVSPLSNSVTAQANSTFAHGGENAHVTYTDTTKGGKKIGRQLSVNSHGNHYADVHRQEAEKALNGGSGNSSQKESFFSHLRKRARRLSGRNQPNASDDVEANAGCMPWSNRSSLALDSNNANEGKQGSDLSELDKALQNVKYSLDTSTLGNVPVQITSPVEGTKRQSMPQGSVRSTMSESPSSTSGSGGPISSRTRRAMQMSTHPVHRYETPEEEDELLDEVLHSANKAAKRLAQNHGSDRSSSYNHQAMGNDNSNALPSPYPTPSPSAKCDGVSFGQHDSTPSRRVDAKPGHASSNRQWPTPPYEEGEWNNPASGTFLTGSTYR